MKRADPVALVLGVALVQGCAAAPARAPDTAGAVAAETGGAVAGGPATRDSLAGEYALQGVMETGSGLQLSRNGSFQWFLVYGALDLLARGKWHVEGDTVVLEVEEFLGPESYAHMRFSRLPLRIEGNDLIPDWPWDDGGQPGRYRRD